MFAERPYDEETGTFGPTDTTEWTPAYRAAVETRLENVLGIALPNEVENDRDFINWLLHIGVYRYDDENRHSPD
jgi:hypothetical protein